MRTGKGEGEPEPLVAGRQLPQPFLLVGHRLCVGALEGGRRCLGVVESCRPARKRRVGKLRKDRNRHGGHSGHRLGVAGPEMEIRQGPDPEKQLVQVGAFEIGKTE